MPEIARVKIPLPLVDIRAQATLYRVPDARNIWDGMALIGGYIVINMSRPSLNACRSGSSVRGRSLQIHWDLLVHRLAVG